MQVKDNVFLITDAGSGGHALLLDLNEDGGKPLRPSWAMLSASVCIGGGEATVIAIELAA